MIYECLIHLPSKTFCDARTKADSRTGRPWGTGEAVFENGEWRGVGDFVLEMIDVPPGSVDYSIPMLGGMLSVMASQIDGR